MPDFVFKTFWTAVAAALAYLSTVTIDVGAEWTPVVTAVFTAVLAGARAWVDKRTAAQ